MSFRIIPPENATVRHSEHKSKRGRKRDSALITKKHLVKESLGNEAGLVCNFVSPISLSVSVTDVSSCGSKLNLWKKNIVVKGINEKSYPSFL